MQYLISFLEGIITFISPCLLPMLPIYISYFASGSEQVDRKKTLRNAIGFVLGFTLVFVVLGAFAGSFGYFLKQHKVAMNLITGGIVFVLGLNFLGILKLNVLNQVRRSNKKIEIKNFGTSIMFGIVFSISWTPCVGAFLGSALMLASERGTVAEGILMLITYSLGLGIPFVVSALLLDRLKGTLDFIKRNYTLINRISGLFLVIIGLLMMTGYMGYFLSLLNF